MEEDIKILENLMCRTKVIAEDLETAVCSIDEQLAIRNLIARNKELEQINKEHQKLNGELQTKLTIAENYNHIPRID